MKREITVTLINGRHVCRPTNTEANPGDTVVWHGNVVIDFVGDTPFEEGLGPFAPNDPQTVRQIPPLTKGQVFQPTIRLDGILRPTEGDIKVT
jgi:hypothetical protein